MDKCIDAGYSARVPVLLTSGGMWTDYLRYELRGMMISTQLGISGGLDELMCAGNLCRYLVYHELQARAYFFLF